MAVDHCRRAVAKRNEGRAMNLQDMPAQTLPNSTEAEQFVLGALLIDNDAIDRIPDLKAVHFYDFEHSRIFAEITRQIAQGKRSDVLTVFDAIGDQVSDSLPYLHGLTANTPSAANIARYAGIVIDKALKRELMTVASELQGWAQGKDAAEEVIDRASAKLEQLAQKRTKQEPRRFGDMLGNYVDVIQARMDGTIKPISTGHADLDSRLGGGFRRGTLIVVAGRPAMGKTAMGLGLARNVSAWGASLFLSMEMAAEEVSDRNISALGKVPLAWLQQPTDETEQFSRMTAAFAKADTLNLFIDDQTGLNMIEIRNKARSVKRKHGLDLIVIDQLSFITGSESDKQWEAVGEYTRALLALGKELNVAVVLLCQLNRELEKRPNKRPMMSDLAMSGSIEQDANTIIFLYRDEVYNPDSMDKGVCEVHIAKQRNGRPGIVGMAYIGEQTRFEDLAQGWQPQKAVERPRSRGFD